MYLKGYTGSIYSDNSWRTPFPECRGYQHADVVFSVLQSYDCSAAELSVSVSAV